MEPIWPKFLMLFALIAGLRAQCNDNVVFFGDIDVNKLPVQYLRVLSTVGVYRRVPNRLNVQIYQHTARPDVFLLRQPTLSIDDTPSPPPPAGGGGGEQGNGEGEGELVMWVIATLPEHKKPTTATAVYQVWPDANSILLEARFPYQPQPPWNQTGWRVPGWLVEDRCAVAASSDGEDDGEGDGWSQVMSLTESLSLHCVHDSRTNTGAEHRNNNTAGGGGGGVFGQCSTGLWRVIALQPSAEPLTGALLRREPGRLINGQPVYSSGVSQAAVDSSGLWRLQMTLIGGGGGGAPVFVSRTPAERFEFVDSWRRLDGASAASGGDDGRAGSDDEVEQLRVVCEGVMAAAAANENSHSVCGGVQCRNNGTCYTAATGGRYVCECRFDTGGAHCESVRECAAPPLASHAHLLYTSDVTLYGKAFYTCAAGYQLVESGATTSSNGGSSKVAFAVCDGSRWLGVPRCVLSAATSDATGGSVTIEDTVLHNCSWQQAATSGAGGWCGGYRRDSVRQLTVGGGAVSGERWQLRDTTAADDQRRRVATASFNRYSSSGSGGGVRVARLQAPCVFVPVVGCLVFDFSVEGGAALSVAAYGGPVLWRSSGDSSQGGAWSTVTVPLPAAGTWQLMYEASYRSTAAAPAAATVRLDQLRVYGSNCSVTGRALFGDSPDSAPRSILSSHTLPALLLSLLVCMTTVAVFM